MGATGAMALRSMTGFGEASGVHAGTRWQIEIKTVNGRSLDLRFRLPAGADALEPGFREACQRRLSRGSCSIAVNLVRESGDTVIRVNEQALAQVSVALNRVATLYPDAAPPTRDGILAIRGVLEVVEPRDDEAVIAQRNVALQQSFEAALEEQLVGGVARAPQRTPERIAARLKEQVERLVDAAGAQLDPARLHQEAMLLATKSDVEEELQRLRSHVAAARELLAAPEAVGRKLDFLAQEFNREANTLCSKSIDSEITRIGLALKAVIDQLREQVQNVE
jgi:uncharacterized protein (TIGR00255 family)